jgi:hypothetical protein
MTEMMDLASKQAAQYPQGNQVLATAACNQTSMAAVSADDRAGNVLCIPRIIVTFTVHSLVESLTAIKVNS